MEDLDIGILRPETLPIAITDFIKVVTMLEVDIGLTRQAIILHTNVEFIFLVTMVEVDLSIKIPANLPLPIVDQDLMLTEEVDTYLRPATFLPITDVAVVDC